MTDLFTWLIDTTIIVSLLLGAVLLLRGTVARLTNVRWAYLLWAVPVVPIGLRLLPEQIRAVPASLADAAGAGGWTPSIGILGDAWLTSPLAGALLVLWAAGFAIALARLLGEHHSARREFLTRARPLAADDRQRLARYCDRMGIFPTVDCVEVAGLEGPALLGLFRPTLLLPKGFMETSEQPELVIRHELVHLRRRDPFFNALAALLRCVFWFNPLIHLAERHFRDDQEVACDRAVMVDASGDERYGYGRALVRSVLPRPTAVTGFMATETALKRRLKLLAHHRVDLAREAAGAFAVVALLLGGIAFGVDAPVVAIDWTAPLTFPTPLPGTCGG